MKKFVLWVLFAVLPMFAVTYAVEESYLINTNEIRASSIVPIGSDQDFEIDQFNGKSAVQINANRLKKIFEAHHIDIEPKTAITTFYFSRDIDIEHIKKILAEQFMTAYPTMQINAIIIRPLSFNDIAGMDIVQIDISPNTVRRSKGSFAVWFGKASKATRIFFSYDLDANIRVLKATKMINSGATISAQNTASALIQFDTISTQLIDETKLYRYIAKGRIANGDIIVQSKVTELPDVRKNTKILVEAGQGGVKLTLYATAQKNAVIGDMIDVKDENGRVFPVRIIGKNRAQVE